jgi:O-antigen ligase
MWRVLLTHHEQVRGVPSGFPPPVSEANVPILGVNVALERYEGQELTAALGRIADGGFVWVRQSFAWAEFDSEAASVSFDWSKIDRIVDAVDAYPELRLVAVLTDAPPADVPDPELFAAFAGAFAERYGDQIDYYQIWDEPNLGSQWGGRANPSAYADLLARAARAVRDADRQARILLAGLAPTTETGPQNLSEVCYLERLYQVGAAPYFDVVAAKPYGFDTGPHDRRVDPSVLNVSRILLLREVMVEHGDGGKAIWASHWGWNALPEGWRGRPSIWGQTDEETQASRTIAMLERARNEWPWIGAMIIETFQPSVPSSGTLLRDLEDPRWGFSLLGPEGTPRPAYHAIADWAESVPAAAPVGHYPADSRWATYEDSWRVGPLGADAGGSLVSDTESSRARSPVHRATFRFDGTRVALTVRRGPYRAFLYVTVDGEPANKLPRDEQGRAYVVLYSDLSRVTTVPLAAGMQPGAHTVEIVAVGGEGQWSLLDWRVGAAPLREPTYWKIAGLAVVALISLVLLFRDVPRVRWAPTVRTYLALPSAAQIALVSVLTGILWVAAALSWGRWPPSGLAATFFLALSLLILPVLVFLFAARLDLGLTLVAVAAPFYLVPTSMVYGALSLPEVLVLLCGVAYALRQVTGSTVEGGSWPFAPLSPPIVGPGPRLSLADVAVTGLVATALLSTMAAQEPGAALFELRAVFLLPALYYALLRLIPLNDLEQQRVADGLVLGGVGVALVGLIQGAAGFNLVAAEGGVLRLQSIYRSPNRLALYLGRIWPFLAASILWGRGTRRRLLSALALAPVILALGLTLSRGALLLALPFSLLIMGWWAGGRYRWMALVFVGVWILGLIPLLRLPRFAALLNVGQGTTFFRLKLWRSSLRMIRDHPLLGVGPGNFLDAYRTRYILPTAWEEFNLGHAHNLLLDHWTRLGGPGVVAGLAVQIVFWRSLAGRWRGAPLVLGLAGGMAALLAHGLVDNTVFFPDLALTFFLMVALAQDGGRPDDGR